MNPKMEANNQIQHKMQHYTSDLSVDAITEPADLSKLNANQLKFQTSSAINLIKSRKQQSLLPSATLWKRIIYQITILICIQN